MPVLLSVTKLLPSGKLKQKRGREGAKITEGGDFVAPKLKRVGYRSNHFGCKEKTKVQVERVMIKQGLVN